MRIRCPFCHEKVFFWAFEAHKARHTRRRADGQMEDHITVAPELRTERSIEDEPKVYYHAKCGQCTGMPEEIIRSYLINPFLYSSRTFCCGCKNYISQSEVIWTETGERLDDYFQRLQQEAPSACDWSPRRSASGR